MDTNPYIPTYRQYVEASYLDDWQRRYKLLAERDALRVERDQLVAQRDRLLSELGVLRSILDSASLLGLQ